MSYYIGLDVSVKKTAICIMDADGTIIKQMMEEIPGNKLYILMTIQEALI